VTTPPPQSLGEGEGVVVVAVPDDLLPGPERLFPPSFLERFARLSGCRVALQRLPADELPGRVALDRGATIDVALVHSWASLRLAEGGAIAPLATDLLEHRDELLEPLRDPAATRLDGRAYGLAYAWGLDVLVSPPGAGPTPSSLEALLDPRYTGAVAMPDEPRSLAVAAILLGAADPFGLTESELAGARALLEAQRPLLEGRFRTPTRLAALLRADALVALAPSTTAAALAREGLTVATTLPREGTTGWIESWHVTVSTRHPVCAYRWINAVTAADAQAALARDGLAPANGEACTLPGPARCQRLGLATADAIGSVTFARTPSSPTSASDWSRAWDVCCGP
jgi:putative spermidine/putrescine transport system substrate-binding protein